MKTAWIRLILSFLTINIMTSLAVHAQTGAPDNRSDANLAGREYDETKEAEVSQKARKRLYPGGKDETDLKVQSQLVNPTRKMAPNMEISNSAEPSSED